MVEHDRHGSARRTRRIPLAFVLLASLALASCSLEGTTDVPGEVNRFDPVATYPAVAAAAGAEAHLVKLEARFVREDGTQDMEASYVGNGAVNSYTFLRASTKSEDPSVPLGARPPVAPFETVEITVQKPHWVSQSINGGEPEQKKHRGMAVSVQSFGSSTEGRVAAPTCAFSKLWALALERGAPKGAVAVITYDAKGYELRIDGTGFRARFDAACHPQDKDKK
jgi:hypothetical protein